MMYDAEGIDMECGFGCIPSFEYKNLIQFTNTLFKDANPEKNII